MTCLDANHVLAYLARDVGEGERRAADEHLDRCASCRALVAELARSPLIGELAAPDPTAEELPRVGRYVLGERLGAGGMGVVYAAYDPELDRQVALKLLEPGQAPAAEVDRLLREGRALARLSHPNVVAVYDAGVADGRVFVAMELVSGLDLGQWLGRQQRSTGQILARFCDAGRGLAAAHAAGVVHRDFKPANVLVGDDGRARVCDFGLAASRAAGLAQGEGSAPAASTGAGPATSPPTATGAGPATSPPTATSLTATGALVGTPALMSPEQHRRERVGPASDQFSFCAALYTALCGQPPFAGDTIDQLRAQVLAGAPRPLPHRAGVPRSVRRAIERGLALDPAARFPSMAALLDAIDPARRARRLRRLAAGGGAGAAALALGLALSHSASPPVPAPCRAAFAARDRVWSEPVQAGVERAIRATGVRYAAETWTQIDASMGRYLGQIAAAEDRVCSSAPRSDQARRTLELSMRCLGERRAEAAALAEELSSVDAAGVRTALSRIQRVLPMVSDCDDSDRLRADATLRASAEGAAAYAEVRAALREARALPTEGRYAEAAAAARRAVKRARAIAHDSLLARALIQLAETSAPVEGFAAAEASAREAVAAAERAGADELRAIALARLMESIAAQPGREREALSLEPLLAAAIERSGMAALEPVRLGSLARAHLGLGRTDEALRELQAALAAQRAALPPHDPRLPAYIKAVGAILGRVGQVDAAIEAHREAAALAEELYGPAHPEVGLHLVRLAFWHGVTGRCDQALRLHQRALSLLRGALPGDNVEMLLLRKSMGDCYAAQGRHDQAMEAFASYLGGLAAAGRERSAEAADGHLGVGEVHEARGDWDAALAEYRLALSIFEDRLGRRDPRLGLPLVAIGSLHRAAGRPARAIAPYERALAIYEAAGVTPPSHADALFGLARALWDSGRDRPRALALGRRARDAYGQLGELGRPYQSAVAEWLAAVAAK